MGVCDWISAVFLALGAFFALTGAVGVLRFPDFYSRLHPAGHGDTLAQTFFLFGLLFQSPDLFMAAKLVLITVFLYITAPTATHAISQAAYLAESSNQLSVKKNI